MIVYAFPADMFGCGWYRIIHAASVLYAQGHDVRVVPPSQRHGLSGQVDQHGNVVDVDVPPDADVMVFQRVTHKQIAQTFPLYRAKGVAVVVDIDDDLDRIDPRNPAWWALHPKSGSVHDAVTCAQACAAATMVTVSTPALLKRYAPQGNGVVLPNMVPEEFFRIPRHDTPVFGWGGSMHSHPGDLQVMGDAPARLLRGGGWMRVVGPPDGIEDTLRLPPFTFEATGNLQLEQWALGLSTLGVGVAPLADTEFNRAKSRLKLLEKSALGVPVVFSPREDYMRLHRETGVGVPADKPKVWYRELKKLVEDGPYRRQKSAETRAAVAHLTYEAQAWRWMDVWQTALDRQRGGVVSVL